MKQESAAIKLFESNPRLRRALGSSAVSALAKCITVGASLITIPVTSEYLGPELFGVWMTLLSFSALTAFADLGVGNGLINLIATCSARGDLSSARIHIANTLAVLAVSAFALVAGAIGIAHGLGVARVFGLQDVASVDEVRNAFLLFFLCTGVGMVLGVVQKIRIGLQQGYQNGIWNIASSLLGLMSLLIAIQYRAQLSGLVGALIGAPLLCLSAHFLYFFTKERRWAIPKWFDISGGATRRLLAYGGMFFMLQLVAAISASADNLIISTLFGAASVGDYAIAARLFSLSTIVVSLTLQPLWPAYADAFTRQDLDWIRRTLRLSVAAAASIAAAVALLVVFGHTTIADLWLGRQLEVDSALLIGFGCWVMVDAIAMALATCLNGISVLRSQVIFGLLMASTSLTLKLWLLPSWGRSAAPLLSAIAILFLWCIPMTRVVQRYVGK